MNSGHRKHLSSKITPRPSTRWLLTLLLLGISFIFYTTLFPFDFFLKSPPTFRAIIQIFDLDFLDLNAFEDAPRNIILFIPVGFAFAGILLKHGVSNKLTLLLAPLFGLLLSGSVELLQMYSTSRFPTLGDILANTLGTILGYAIYLMWGNNIYGKWSTFLNWLQQKLSFRRLLITYLVFVGIILIVSLVIQKQANLSNWQTNFPLILGNEYSEGQPWKGLITNLYLADKVVDEAEIEALLAGKQTKPLLTNSLVAYYDFTTNGAGNFPSLTWQGTPVFGREAGGALFSERQWLLSEGNVYQISNALRNSSAFTLGLVVAAGDLEQYGPARLFSISNGIDQRNLTVGQEGSDLILRLRTPFNDQNGRHPEFIIPDIFTDTDLHHIIITYDGTTLQLIVDQPDNLYMLELIPAVVLFSLLPPAPLEQMRINRGNMLVFHLLYNALILVPLAGLLVYKLRGSSYNRKQNWIIILTVTLLSAVLWEVIVTLLISGYRLQIEYILRNIPLFLSAVAYGWWLTRPTSKSSDFAA